jgi:hypothetical protein
MKARGAVVAVLVVLLMPGCSSSSGQVPEIKDNGTCTFSGSVTGTHPCTVAGAYTTSELMGVIEISYNTASDYDAGVVVGATLYGTIAFPAAPVAGTYSAPTTGTTLVAGATLIELLDVTSGDDWWASTALGSFTLVLSSVELLGDDPDIGSIYLPKGTLDATLVPTSSSTTGNVRVQATF